MDKFCEKHKLSNLPEDKINNLNNIISNREIVFLIKNLSAKKTPCLNGFVLIIPTQHSIEDPSQVC